MPDNGNNIDRRLDRLTERHEALTQTVEIIAGMQRENEERMARNEERLSRLIDVMTELARIVQSHERRLNDLESP